MPSLFSRRKDSLSNTSPTRPTTHPTEVSTSSSELQDVSTPPSAFNHYRKRSMDATVGGRGGGGVGSGGGDGGGGDTGRTSFGIRRGSTDLIDQNHGNGGLLSLKNKFANVSRSKLPFFHPHASTLESKSPSDGGARRASMGNDPLKNVDKRTSLVFSGMANGGASAAAATGDENALRRGSAPVQNTSLLDSPASEVVGGSWIPLEPTRSSIPSSISVPSNTVKPLPATASTMKHEEEVDSGYGGSMPGGTSDYSGSGGLETLNGDSIGEGSVELSPLGHGRIPSTVTSSVTSPLSATTSMTPGGTTTSSTSTTTTTAAPSRSRPDIGKLDIPPPPLSLASRRQNTGMGMIVVPSAPPPQPIANLPTLGGGVGGQSRNETGGSVTCTGKIMSVGQELGTSGSGGRDDSTIEPTLLEVRKARNAMPVMLREPSNQPTPEAHDHEGGHIGDDSSSASSFENGESDSGSESGTDEAVSEEQHASVSTGTRSRDDGILGGIARKPLVSQKATRHGRRRSSGGTGVGSINEEEELESPPLADRRQVPRPRLGTLPESSASTYQSTATWGLPTPKTPGDEFQFTPVKSNPTSGWTQFGTMTPMARTPGFNTFSARSTNVNQFSKVKELGRTPMATPVNRPEHGYFDIFIEQANAPVPTDEVRGAISEAPLRGESGVPGPAPTIEEPAVTLAQPNDTSKSPPIAAPISIASETPLTADPIQSLPVQPIVVQMIDDEDLFRTPMQSHPKLPGAEGRPVIPDSIPEDRETPVGTPAIDEGNNGSERGTSTVNSTPNPGSSTADLGVAVMTIPEQPSAPPAVGSIQPDQPPRRPTLYTQHSRSMVNLSPAGVSGTSTPDSRVHSSNTPSVLGMDINTAAGSSTPVRTSGQPDWARPPPTPTPGLIRNSYFGASPTSSRPATPGPPNAMRRQESRGVGSPLKRTRSMDDVRPFTLPDYTPPEPGSRFPQPREEEGREGLPNYWCHVHIEGYLPRKMEFSSPGVQSRDRSWKRLYFVLHGTALSIYKHDVHKLPLKEPGAAPIPAVDPADAENLHVHLPGEKRSSSVSTTIATNTATRRSSAGTEPMFDRGRRGSTDMSIQPAPLGGHRNSLPLDQNMQDAKDAQLFPASQRPRAASNAPSVTPSSNSGGNTIHAKELATHLPFHAGNALVKQYSMQNAESGLAADYVKRKNVVRVRAAGEQFLLQTESAKEVVNWIEAFQAATNVSLELDVRPMPKIITLPRRRRRRRPGEPAAPGVPSTEDTPEGNARAVAAAEAAANGGNVDAMERMLAEDQAAGV